MGLMSLGVSCRELRGCTQATDYVQYSGLELRTTLCV
uniref:SFRICE_036675 n=1 Tax=Spodoptera frugiperda TaxID=7108 RepID=A0A2H1WER3_SPOFR